METCKICGSKFVPEPKQKKASWAVNWCTGDSGLLCPPCHAAAKKLKAIGEDLPLGILPFKSDIAKISSAVSKKDWEKMRHSESWRIYVEQNHPDWITGS